MSSGIDHVIIFVDDLAAASRDFEGLGLTVTPGGEHANGVTHNALISFEDGSYLELIAFVDPARPANDEWSARMRRGEGLVGFALRGGDLAQAAAAASQRGLAVRPPAENGRLRPDGQRIGWRTFGAAASEPAVLPFVIEDLTPRELRVPGGPATRHRAGVTRVQGVVIHVGDLDRTARAFAALLGTAGTAAPAGAGGPAAVRFATGQHWIELRATGPDGEGLAELHLERGGAASSNADELLPPPATHGARIRLVG